MQIRFLVRLPHGMTWDTWYQRTRTRAPGFRDWAYQHWDAGNPPNWADYCWSKLHEKERL